MRIYGMRSGRNNMNRLIARSIMYNTPKKSRVMDKQSTEEKSTKEKLWDKDHPIASLIAWIIMLILLSPLILLIVTW
jgi:hypothetical protein